MKLKIISWDVYVSYNLKAPSHSTICNNWNDGWKLGDNTGKFMSASDTHFAPGRSHSYAVHLEKAPYWIFHCTSYANNFPRSQVCGGQLY